MTISKNTRVMAVFGCSWEQYAVLAPIKKAIRAYRQQRKNAIRRGISWELSLPSWWALWQSSGKWALRGRGHRYMMCRVGDAGAYVLGNVYIARGIVNASAQARKTKDTPIGVYRVSRKTFAASRRLDGKAVYLGSFASVEAAQAAYEAADPMAEK